MNPTSFNNLHSTSLLGKRPTFRYPENVGQAPVDKFMLFQAKAGRHIIRSQMGTKPDSTLAAVALYLPPGALKTSIAATWTPADIGQIMGSMVEASGGALEEVITKNGSLGGFQEKLLAGFKNNNNPQGGSAPTTIMGMTIPAGMMDILKTVSGSAQEIFIGQALEHFAGALGGDGKAAVGAATGHVANPKTDLVFSNVGFRSHQFDFQLVPRNLNEAHSIDEIIHFFQFYMLPSFGTNSDGTSDLPANVSPLFIGYPHEFEILMCQSGVPDTNKTLMDANNPNSGHLKHINRIGRSVLTACDIDHAGAGKVAFIRGDGTNDIFPAATKLSLTFTEVRLLGRDSDTIKRLNRMGTGSERLIDKTEV